MQHRLGALGISRTGTLERPGRARLRGLAPALLALALAGACVRGTPAASAPAADSPPAAAAPAPGLAITYIGNEGFLLAAGDQRVLVDALYDAGIPGLARLPEAERARLEHASPPFDGIDVVLVTHAHPDHFQAAAVTAHLRAGAAAHLVAAGQAVAALREHAGDAYADLAARVTGVQAKPGEQVALELAGVKLRALSMTHAADLPIDHLGFAIQLGDAAVLHLGDTGATAEQLAAFQLHGQASGRGPIDVALVPYWLFLDPGAWTKLRQAIGARRYIVMHLPRPDAPVAYFAPADTLDALVAMVRRSEPGVIVLAEPMQSWTP